MLVRMSIEIREAKIEEEGGCYTLEGGWKVFQGDDIITLEHENEGVLKITSKGEVLYNPSSKIRLEKKTDSIKLNDLIVEFGGFDITVKLNDLIVEFQSFLEDPFTIELS